MEQNKKLNIHFYGGVGKVTGANFLLEQPGDGGKQFLIDCGLIQGTKSDERENYDPFAYDVKKIDALFITHAHLDHIGRIPKLVKMGYEGPIYSTAPTMEIAEVSLADSIKLLQNEAKEVELPPLYDENDAKKALSQWKTLEYHQPVQIGDFTIVLRDSGHILGSAMIEFMYQGKKIVFTGDLGNSPAPLLKDTEAITDAEYMVMESVYGDRNHENREDRRLKLEDVIEETMRRGGTLMIPAFSVERTQELLFEIENMMESSRIPLVPVYLDSPLAIAVTSIYKKYSSYFNKEANSIRLAGDGIFTFPQLHMTPTTEQSKAIMREPGRKIIIAGSGMSSGGRIMHHERNYLPDPKSNLLLAGYQQVGSLGRQLQDGAKMVRIHGEDVSVNAHVESIHGYSAHKDMDHLIEFVDGTDATLKKVFVCMGEPKSSLFLAQRIKDYLGINAVVPEEGQTIEIEI
ncbi:MAG: MBL fold metallo-hydrolase [Candidatus Paceibacterota bacterium]|jgi:metallo-beta-lactamase family protein